MTKEKNDDSIKRRLANQIAQYLFINAMGDTARRLVFELDDGRDGGGWSFESIRDRIESHFNLFAIAPLEEHVAYPREEMAIMKHVRLGMGDRGEPVMTFACLQEGCGAEQVLSWRQAGELLKQTGFGSIDCFEGKPCIVSVSNGDGVSGKMLFRRMAAI